MSLPFNLNRVFETASLVEGYDFIERSFPVVGKFTKRTITHTDAIFESLQYVAEQYQDWPTDQGFGSSDMTYVRKLFIDNMITLGNLNGYYETKFQPYLKVVEYSEAEYHEKMLRIEQGV